MQIKIKITNALTGQVVKDFTAITVDSITQDDIYYMHNGYSKGYPECHVNFTWDDGNCYIYGVPRDMWKDENAYQEGLITYEQFCDKWYSGVLPDSKIN